LPNLSTNFRPSQFINTDFQKGLDCFKMQALSGPEKTQQLGPFWEETRSERAVVGCADLWLILALMA